MPDQVDALGSPDGPSGADDASGESTRQRLADAAQQLGLALEPHQIAQLERYLAMVQKWNRVYNLTALRDPALMLTHHLFDSLAVVVPLRKRLETQLRQGSEAAPPASAANAGTTVGAASARVLDVGSGAGLPGVVLAICQPTLRVTCVDAVAKKAAFIQQVALELKLSNIQSRHARVETLAAGAETGVNGVPRGGFDIVCSRAFASLADFVALTRGALAPCGTWMALKGKTPSDEIAALDRDEVDVFHVEPLVVPELAAERCIVWMKKRGLASPAEADTA